MKNNPYLCAHFYAQENENASHKFLPLCSQKRLHLCEESRTRAYAHRNDSDSQRIKKEFLIK